MQHALLPFSCHCRLRFYYCFLLERLDVMAIHRMNALILETLRKDFRQWLFLIFEERSDSLSRIDAANPGFLVACQGQSMDSLLIFIFSDP
jgi:hypothetical protein